MKVQANQLGHFLSKVAMAVRKAGLLSFEKEGLVVNSSVVDEIGCIGFYHKQNFENYEAGRKLVIPDMRFFVSLVKGFYSESIELQFKENSLVIKSPRLEVEIPFVLEKYFKPLEQLKEKPFLKLGVNRENFKSLLNTFRLVGSEQVSLKLSGNQLILEAQETEKVRAKMNLSQEVRNFGIVLPLKSLLVVSSGLVGEVDLIFYSNALVLEDKFLDSWVDYYIKMLVLKEGMKKEEKLEEVSVETKAESFKKVREVVEEAKESVSEDLFEGTEKEEIVGEEDIW